MIRNKEMLLSRSIGASSIHKTAIIIPITLKSSKHTYTKSDTDFVMLVQMKPFSTSNRIKK